MNIFINLKKVFLKLSRINLLIEPNVRFLITYLRALYFVKIRKRLKTVDSHDAIKRSISHNLKSVLPSNDRIKLLFNPLSVIELLNKESKILVIGPRNESNLFFLRGMGFKKENIIGLDMISYVPSIKLGDMHNLPFETNSFDAVACGWTLSYSNDPKKAANEMLRVVKSNGLIGIAVEYSTMTSEDEIAMSGYILQENSGGRINSTEQILQLFSPNVKEIFFNHNAPNKISHSSQFMPNVSNISSIFSVKK
jgi:SAM-dependent methyltransferase